MKTPDFNLIEEPWIRVIDSSCRIHELSIKDVLCDAHQYIGLKGELPTQDVAVMRLLLAILHTVFSRVDEKGDPSPVEDEDMALERWSSLWDMGCFPQEPIIDYLEKWKDRFWLFHETRPFFQTPSAQKGTVYSAAKLNGELSESNFKIRLFSSTAGSAKQQMTFAESARWLLYVNAYDDTSAKRKEKGLPSPGVGWLGKLGLLYAEGNSLFETLVLNLVFLKDGKEVWQENHPVWEENFVRSEERKEIETPDNAAQLLTVQSRRLFLHREGNHVTGFSLLGGDFFDRVNAGQEQMTVWCKVNDKSSPIPLYQPKRHDSTRKMWREFPNVFGVGRDVRKPGIVSWIALLKKENLIPHSLIRFCIASVQYGKKDTSVTDIFADVLSFHVALLTELGTKWMDGIKDEIDSCNEAANYIGFLENDILKASGNTKETGTARERFYYRIDIPFRRWIESLDPDAKRVDILSRQNDWHQEAKKIAKQMGKEMISDAGIAAMTGRTVQEETDESRYYSAPDAYNRFRYRIDKLYGG